MLCAMACGVACALGAREEEEGKRRVNAEGGERLPRSPYLLTVEEIVARDFLRTIPVTDGE